MKREDIHVRDPFVYVEDGKYYLVGTTCDDPWGRGSDFTLYVSEDLENFEKKCRMVDDALFEGYTNLWAPELHKFRDKYYLIVSAYRKDLGRGSFILVSDSLEEKFTFLTGKYITPSGWGCLDATLFVYEGAPYLCFSNEWLTPITEDGDGSLFIARLNDDLTTFVDEPKKIVSGKNFPLSVEIGSGKKGYLAEGPYLYEQDGNIVLLWSGWSKTGYSVFKNVSKNGVYGDYVFEKTVYLKDGGHCMRFTDLQGNSYITLHQPNVTPNERMRLFPDKDE